MNRPRVMGILNLTPDSFSDGGKYLETGEAVERGLEMARQGADIIDVGGESTRPGAVRVEAREQCHRVIEVIRGLRARLPAETGLSIDTTLSAVAQAAVEAGADMLNDISAGREDAGMFRLAAQRSLPLVLMHMQGTPVTMQEQPRYENVVEEVREFLLRRADAAQAAGVAREQLVLDPGIGFGKTRAHNMALLRGLQRLVECGYPVLLGASRKRFMGALHGGELPTDRVGATCAATALGVQAGVQLFRVHDVHENRQAADLAWEWQQGGG